ncbi:hypothetical protein AB0F81_15560 [Actinoplanes sp. NPDC024001]|uniref:vWA domain-containing protein n=1 Tax=Actinoplanes sp. NPDC024001 TaxID=3154598 RepID=UPI0033DD0195
MTNPLPLIVSETPVPRGPFKPEASRSPSVATVYATGTGDVVSFQGKPVGWWQRSRSAFQTRYDVDMREHHRTVELRSKPLPSRGDVYFFIATVDVSFRVHDPEEIVRRGVQDALPLVYGHLVHVFRSITRGFDIEQSTEAEEAIRRRFAGEVRLQQGITILGVAPQLRPDEAASEFLKAKVEAVRELERNKLKQQVAVQDAINQAQLGEIGQMARLKAAQNEHAALAKGPLTAMDMAREHLVRHPEDTEKVMRLLMEHESAMLEREDANNVRTTEFVKFMMQQGNMHPGDFEPFLAGAANRMGVGGPTAGPAIAAPPGTSTWGAEPAAEQPAPVILQQDPATKVWRPADGVQPVYLLVDESANARPYLDDLTDGLRTLLDGLTHAPEVAPAIRLSVLGYAGQVAMRRQLGEVDAGSQAPWITSQGGAVSYTNTFESLLSQITPDVEALKEQGLKVLRPIVFVLAASPAAESDAWLAAHRRLVDTTSHRYAPYIIACGVGDAPATLVSRIATNPEFGFVMAPGSDAHTAIEQYWQALLRNVLASGRSLIEGRPQLAFEAPPSFQPAGHPSH